jgi:hypothetical protein
MLVNKHLENCSLKHLAQKICWSLHLLSRRRMIRPGPEDNLLPYTIYFCFDDHYRTRHITYRLLVLSDSPGVPVEFTFFLASQACFELQVTTTSIATRAYLTYQSLLTFQNTGSLLTFDSAHDRPQEGHVTSLKASVCDEKRRPGPEPEQGAWLATFGNRTSPLG